MRWEQCPSAVKPEQKGTMTMYLEQEWFRLTVRDEYRSTDPVKGLDVSILQRELLGPVLGIEDPKMDERIGFIGGIRGLGELERRVDTDCAVAFRPVSDLHRRAVPRGGRGTFDAAEINVV